MLPSACCPCYRNATFSSRLLCPPTADISLRGRKRREGPDRDLGGAIAHLQSMRSLAALAANQLPHAHRDDLDRELYRVAEAVIVVRGLRYQAQDEEQSETQTSEQTHALRRQEVLLRGVHDH
jgi:hypothetical protein